MVNTKERKEMYQIAVCDDEKALREEVKKLILEWDSALKVHLYSSGEDLLDNYLPFQVIFLDVEMEGMGGIETGKRIRQRDKEVKIVYLTAYRDYVAGAFEVHAFQYMVKPVNRERLFHILEEIFLYVKKSEEKHILDFQTVKGMVCLPTEEIYYFAYENRRVLMAAGEESYYLAEKIGNVLKRMAEFGFSMPHQSFVVNLFHVKNIRNQEILLDNGAVIPLSQKKQKLFKQEMAAYLSERLKVQRGNIK
jgi:Response regulator of the LytR/AlgR family